MSEKLPSKIDLEKEGAAYSMKKQTGYILKEERIRDVVTETYL